MFLLLRQPQYVISRVNCRDVACNVSTETALNTFWGSNIGFVRLSEDYKIKNQNNFGFFS